MEAERKRAQELAAIAFLVAAVAVQYDRRARRERLHRRIEDIPIIGDIYWTFR